MKNSDSVVLIGPPCSGKSTQGLLLSTKLSLNSVSIDKIASKHYLKYGFNKELFDKIERQQGFIKAYQEWEVARFNATKEILANTSNSVIDFGAGHSHYFNNVYNVKIRQVLLEYLYVVLLLPSRDKKESLKILRQRNLSMRGKTWIKEGVDLLHNWIFDDQNYVLSTVIVYTKEKSQEEITDAIYRKLNYGGR